MKEEKKDALELVRQKVSGMEAMLEKFQVTNDEELTAVAEKIKQVKTMGKFVEQEKKKLTDPAKAIIKEAGEKYDPFIKQCKNAEETLKFRAGTYMELKEKERIAAEEKIAARVEKGTMKAETAVRKMEELPEAKREVATPNAGLRMTKRKNAVVVDPEGQRKALELVMRTMGGSDAAKMVPAEFWLIDEVEVRREALAREKDGRPQLNGVKIIEETVMASS